MKKKSTEREQCSLFEEMLMWTSYRYCIGRHTYVTSLAGEIAQHYYNRLSDERMEFTATDIRGEIYDKLQLLPFNFRIHRIYTNDSLNPLDGFLTFIRKNNIDTIDELYKYTNIEYNAHTDEYNFEIKKPTIKSYFSVSDIDDLIPWENLAACFDKKNHKIVTTEYEGKTETHRCFKSWKRVSVPCEDKPGYYKVSEFGWTPIWIVVDEYLKTGNTNRYIVDEFITKVEDIKEKEEI